LLKTLFNPRRTKRKRVLDTDLYQWYSVSHNK